MIDRTNVAALIPAFREERFIAGVVERVRVHLDTVLVVDDGSPDATGSLAEKAGAEVLRHERNQGKGAAIKTGLRELTRRGFEYVLLLDGDGQHLPEEIPAFLETASRTAAGMILGNRMADIREMPFVRRCTNQFMSWLISRCCGQPIPDTQCGFRMVQRELATHLFCESNNYDYETEMLLIAAKHGAKIVAVPVSTVYGEETSKIHPVTDTIRFFQLLARYRD